MKARTGEKIGKSFTDQQMDYIYKDLIVNSHVFHLDMSYISKSMLSMFVRQCDFSYLRSKTTFFRAIFYRLKLDLLVVRFKLKHNLFFKR